jgi:hypothetical protein
MEWLAANDPHARVRAFLTEAQRQQRFESHYLSDVPTNQCSPESLLITESRISDFCQNPSNETFSALLECRDFVAFISETVFARLLESPFFRTLNRSLLELSNFVEICDFIAVTVSSCFFANAYFRFEIVTSLVEIGRKNSESIPILSAVCRCFVHLAQIPDQRWQRACCGCRVLPALVDFFGNLSSLCEFYSLHNPLEHDELIRIRCGPLVAISRIMGLAGADMNAIQNFTISLVLTDFEPVLLKPIFEFFGLLVRRLNGGTAYTGSKPVMARLIELTNTMTGDIRTDVLNCIERLTGGASPFPLEHYLKHDGLNSLLVLAQGGIDSDLVFKILANLISFAETVCQHVFDMGFLEFATSVIEMGSVSEHIAVAFFLSNLVRKGSMAIRRAVGVLPFMDFLCEIIDGSEPLLVEVILEAFQKILEVELAAPSEGAPLATPLIQLLAQEDTRTRISELSDLNPHVTELVALLFRQLDSI